MTKNKFTAAIIGLGKIAQGYDFQTKNKSTILTHAKAFSTHRGFTLVGGVDVNLNARKTFSGSYGAPAFDSIHRLFADTQPEVISICTPTPLHFDTLKEIVAYNPKAIICEKPLSQEVAEAKKMVSLAKKNNITLVVNHMRRFEPGVLELKKRITENKLGSLAIGHCYYYGGFYNNASHIIDLFCFLIGRPSNVKIIKSYSNKNSKDCFIDFKINFGNTEVYFYHSPITQHSLYEAEVFGTNGSFSLKNGGEVIKTRSVGNDLLFPSYKTLLCNEQLIKTNTAKFQLHVVNALHRHLTKRETLNSTGQSALETLKLMDMIKRQL